MELNWSWCQNLSGSQLFDRFSCSSDSSINIHFIHHPATDSLSMHIVGAYWRPRLVASFSQMMSRVSTVRLTERDSPGGDITRNTVESRRQNSKVVSENTIKNSIFSQQESLSKTRDCMTYDIIHRSRCKKSLSREEERHLTQH